MCWYRQTEKRRVLVLLVQTLDADIFIKCWYCHQLNLNSKKKHVSKRTITETLQFLETFDTYRKHPMELMRPRYFYALWFHITYCSACWGQAGGQDSNRNSCSCTNSKNKNLKYCHLSEVTEKYNFLRSETIRLFSSLCPTYRVSISIPSEYPLYKIVPDHFTAMDFGNGLLLLQNETPCEELPQHFQWNVKEPV